MIIVMDKKIAIETIVIERFETKPVFSDDGTRIATLARLEVTGTIVDVPPAD